MKQILEFAALGIGAGAIYALLAQGLVLINIGSGVLNFAQGAVAGVAAMICHVELRERFRWPILFAIVVSTLVFGLLGGLFHHLVLRRLRHASPLVRMVSTLGIYIILLQGSVIRWGGEVRTTTRFFATPRGRYEVGGITFLKTDLMLLAIASALTLLLWGLARFTVIGLAMRAAAEKEVAAAALGWSPDLLGGVSWGLGCGIAALAGILIAPVTSFHVATISTFVISALAVALVGKFSSFPVTLVAGVGLGMAEAVTQFKLPTVTNAGTGVPFLLILLLLIVTGRGLPLRSHVLTKLPTLGSGIIEPRRIARGSVIVLAAMFLLNTTWRDAFITSFGFALVMLSVVVLTGFAGQLSLAQFAMAGFGAMVAARLVESAHWPFEFALLAAVLATIPIGFLFALPALRTRGVTLAIVTLGAANAVYWCIFQLKRFGGGNEGFAIGTQTFFGIDINPITKPERYAALCFALFLLGALGVANLRRSSVGRRLLAIRANERAAAALGISVFEAKLYAFAVAGMIAGLGGIVMVFRNTVVTLDGFHPIQSIFVLQWTVTGGVGYVVGPVAGLGLTPGVGSILGRFLTENRGFVAGFLLLHYPIYLFIFAKRFRISEEPLTARVRRLAIGIGPVFCLVARTASLSRSLVYAHVSGVG